MLTPIPVLSDLVAAADLNGDGSIEFVLGSFQSPALGVYTCLDTAPDLQTTASLPNCPVALAAGDFNQDGAPELGVGLIDGRVLLYVVNERLNFKLAGAVELPAPATDLEICTSEFTTPSMVVTAASSIYVFTPAKMPTDIPPVSLAAVQSVDLLARKREPTSDKRLRAAGVTRREREVLRLALTGLSARQIGARLFIAERTVESHLAHAYIKLGVRSRFELMLQTVDDRWAQGL